MPTQSHVLPTGYSLQWYQIQSVLGQGGFGITYLARDTNLDIEVAIKEYLPAEFAVREIDSTVMPRSDDLSDSYAWGRERFLDEARLLATFDHPAIVRVHTFLEANNTAYMVMRFEHGASLKHWFRQREFSEDELLDVLHVVMDGVEILH
jgi:serine/threonine protein kinase